MRKCVACFGGGVGTSSVIPLSIRLLTVCLCRPLIFRHERGYLADTMFDMFSC